MKIKLSILLLFFSLNVFAQYDSTKALQIVNTYGNDNKNARFRNSIIIPTDTIKMARKDSGAIVFKSSNIYLWDGYKWVKGGISVLPYFISKNAAGDSIILSDGVNTTKVKDSIGGGGGGLTYTLSKNATRDSTVLTDALGNRSAAKDSLGTTDTSALRNDLDIATAQGIANAAAIQQRIDSLRNNAGVLEARKGGVFVPQFLLPAVIDTLPLSIRINNNTTNIAANTIAINNRYDSLRRFPGSVQVEGLKNGVWYPAFIDSTGGGGGGFLAIGSAITSATPGSILFAGTGGQLQQRNAQLFWDSTNNRLGLGTTTPTSPLDIRTTMNAASGLAVGLVINPSLVATVNNDILSGLDIVPRYDNPNAIGTRRLYTFRAQGPTSLNDGLILEQSLGRLGLGIIPTAKFHIGAVAGANGGINLDLQSNGSAASSYSSIDFNVPSTGLTGQFLATASNYSSGGSVNLAPNSITLASTASSGQLAMIAGGGSGIFTVNTGGYALANERLRITSTGNVGIGTSTPAANSVLDITSTTKGFLPPRMTTTQRDLIVNPPNGLIIFCTDCTATDTSTGVSQTYSSTSWRNHY